MTLRTTSPRSAFRISGNAKPTIESILAALGSDESDPNTEILTADPAESNALQGAYYAG